MDVTQFQNFLIFLILVIHLPLQVYQETFMFPRRVYLVIVTMKTNSRTYVKNAFLG